MVLFLSAVRMIFFLWVVFFCCYPVSSMVRAFSFLHVTTHKTINADSSSSRSRSRYNILAQNCRLYSNHQISIEYCSHNLTLRAFWFAQELLTTFANDLEAVTLIPSACKTGWFVIEYSCSDGGSSSNSGANKNKVLWNHHKQQSFLDIKSLKQLVRDEIDPTRSLGHSDNAGGQKNSQRKEAPTLISPTSKTNDCEIDTAQKFIMPLVHAAKSPHLAIAYCTGCRWMLRAAYYSQEVLQDLSSEISSVTLVPCKVPAGTFSVICDTEVIWDRKEKSSFPESNELKHLLLEQLDLISSSSRNHSADKHLHSDFTQDNIDDEEAEKARRFFGVL